jgi:LPXTG-site transpeptidase (sortase) family protein
MASQGALRVRVIAYVLGTILFVVGLGILLGVGGLYAIGEVDRLRLEQELAATPLVTATAEPSPTELPAPTATPSPQATRLNAANAATRSPTAIPSTATPLPTATPIPRPAQRIVAPKIALDSRVVEAPIVNGQWQVPKFVAGHLELTANPGEVGNTALVGHVESISSGNVFSSIGDLDVGDPISVFTDRAELRYVVAEKRIVKNDDLSVVQPTKVETLTLITCYGTFLPAVHDYDRRLIIIAHRAPAAPPAVRDAQHE